MVILISQDTSAVYYINISQDTSAVGLSAVGLLVYGYINGYIWILVITATSV